MSPPPSDIAIGRTQTIMQLLQVSYSLFKVYSLNLNSDVQVANAELNNLEIQGSFCTDGLVCKNPIMVSDISENNFYAAGEPLTTRNCFINGISGEWIEFFSVFFNREAVVSKFSDKTRQRWVASSQFAMSISNKKRILFVSYWKVGYPAYGTYKGWEVKTCDPSTSYSRYCELVKAAGGIAVNDDTSALEVPNDSMSEGDS
eukprot:763403-Hanusia_phi.AAC.3